MVDTKPVAGINPNDNIDSKCLARKELIELTNVGVLTSETLAVTGRFAVISTQQIRGDV